MPALAFGLKGAKSQAAVSKPAPKRKAVFDDEPDDDSEGDSNFVNLQKPRAQAAKLNPLLQDKSGPSRKSPKLSDAPSQSATASLRYTNLSALRTAKLHDEEASKLDASVYDYDAVYDTFHAPKDVNKADSESSGPKYMGSLLQSAEVRKRDQLRAKEKLLQKEREAEGDEFADKEKFVTGAYKQQQEEMRKLEEDERKREQEEEERRRKGSGMTAFNKSLLQKEEERQARIERAAEEARKRKEEGESAERIEDEDELDENKMAAQLNAQGGKIVMNDEGEVVDKRQLLNAGLNTAPKKPGIVAQTKKTAQADRPQEWRRTNEAHEARMSQRERQTRMMERQIEEMAANQRQAEEAERKELEERSKTKLTDEAKMSAKERYLQRKREREEQANKAKTGG